MCEASLDDESWPFCYPGVGSTARRGGDPRRCRVGFTTTLLVVRRHLRNGSVVRRLAEEVSDDPDQLDQRLPALHTG